MKKLFLLSIMLSSMAKGYAYQPNDDAVGHEEPTSDEILQQKLEDLGVTFTDDNSIRLLDSGEKKFSAMLATIREARNYVHLEYFNFRNDSLGRVLFTLLAEKVKEGVQVRAMFDGFGNSSNDSPLKKEHIRLIRESGVEIYEFDPIRFPWVNHALHRDHRKIVVVDGLVAYAGGMNVADYYIHGRPEFGAWRDMHMELRGPVVAQYEEIFERMWWQVSGQIILPEMLVNTSVNLQDDTTNYGSGTATSGNDEKPAVALTPADLGGNDIEHEAIQQQIARHQQSIGTTVTGARIGVVDRSPHKQSKMMRKAYVAAIDAARQHIQIINPYPTNVKSVRRAIWRALKRGVQVEIMVSAKSDVPITPDVVGLEMKHMAKRGAQVWYNNDGFHHSKVMMVDERFCTVGSTNLDARSFLYDYEVNSFILNTQTTAELVNHFEKEKANCERFRNEDWRTRFNLGHRITARLFSLVRGFF